MARENKMQRRGMGRQFACRDAHMAFKNRGDCPMVRQDGVHALLLELRVTAGDHAADGAEVYTEAPA